MTKQAVVVECGNCRQILDESPSVGEEERTPCPKCGYILRHVRVDVEDTVVARDDLAVKAKREGERKPFVEQKVGQDFHRASGTWRHRQMVVDRENDRYKKVVTNPVTGEELYRMEEPLSGHTGRGTAKRKASGRQKLKR